MLLVDFFSKFDAAHLAVTGVVLTYLVCVRILRRRHDRFLEDVEMPTDPKSAHKLMNRFSNVDFPFISTKSLEFAMFKTYAVPSISKTLHSTRQFVDHCPRRCDDTDLLVREIIEQAPDSERSTTALRRLNFLHGQYQISNEDYLFTLLLFIVEPVRWVDRFGYRRTHEKEKMALYLRWKDVGEKMGIHSIPPSFEAAVEVLEKLEEQKSVFHPSNVVVVESTIRQFLSIIPSFLHPLARRVTHALCPPRLRLAMGFPEPSDLLISSVELGLWVAGLVVRHLLPPRTTPYNRTPSTAGGSIPDCPLVPNFHPYKAVYPAGYRIERLGPQNFEDGKQLGKLYGCPFAKSHAA